MAARATGGKKKKKAKRKAKASCFTIMPFGGWPDDYYESIYVPAIEGASLTPRRADDLFRPSTIVSDIWEMTREAQIVLADLTGKNANVFYELGLAHALAKPAILVAESMDDIPFDLRSLRIITYDKNDPSWGEILRTKIGAAIREVLAAPVDAVLPAFLKVSPSNSASTVTREQKDLLEIRQDLDLLRREMRGDGLRHERQLDPSSARRMIAALLEAGVSKAIITERMLLSEVPASWARRQIMFLSRNTKVRRGLLKRAASSLA
jgi:hypothetical protein